MKNKLVSLIVFTMMSSAIAASNCSYMLKGNLTATQKAKVERKLSLKGYKKAQSSNAAKYILTAKINTYTDYTNVHVNPYGTTKISVSLKNTLNNMLELNVSQEVLRGLFTQSINDKAFVEISKTLNKLNFCY